MHLLRKNVTFCGFALFVDYNLTTVCNLRDGRMKLMASHWSLYHTSSANLYHDNLPNYLLCVIHSYYYYYC